MTKSVRVLAILMPLAAWPLAAEAQEPAQMDCKPGTFHAQYGTENHEPLNVKGREGAIRYLVAGDVRITCNDITIEADEMESVSDEPLVKARGHVVFKETGLSISADRAVINRTTHLGTFYTVSGTLRITDKKPQGDLFGGLEPDAYFAGDSLEKTAPKTYVLTNGVLTTCTQPTPRWYMSFSGTITQGKHVFMHDLVLRVKNVPLLYLPVFYYPITQNGRNTGFLMPSYGSSTSKGFTLNNAFFLVLGRSMDATFMHSYFKKAGTGFGGEYRYVETAGTGTASIAVVDQKAQLATDTSIAQPAQTSFTFNANVNQNLPHHLRLISRDSFFSSAQAQQQYQQNVEDLSQRQSRLLAKLSGSQGRLGFGVLVDLVDTYSGQDAPAQRRGDGPMVDFSIAPKTISHSKVYFGLAGTAGYLIRQDNVTDPTTVHSLWRTDVTPTVRAPVGSLSFLTVTTSASWRFTSWSQSTAADDPNHSNLPVALTRQLFTAQVNLEGPMFGRIYELKPNDYAEKLKHVIKPYFNLSWNSPFADSARVVQTDGIDGVVGGTVSMDYGIRTQLLAKRWTGPHSAGTTTTKEILSGSISQRYFSNLLAAAYGQQDSSTGLYNPPAASPFTPVSLNITGRPLDYATASFTTNYDTHFHTLRDYSVSGGLSRPLVQVTVGWNKRAFIPGLPGYDSPDAATNYLNGVATLKSHSGHFGGTYAANLDVKHSTFLQQRVIVFYNSQCCGISFDYQTLGAGTGLPADRRFGFSFTLAGIGSFANPFGSFGGGGS